MIEEARREIVWESPLLSQIPDQHTRNPPAANERSIILKLGPFWEVLLTEISQKVRICMGLVLLLPAK